MEQFVKLYTDVLSEKKVSHAARAVYCGLYHYQQIGKDKKLCYPKTSTIATWLGCSPITVTRATKNLRDNDWLEKKRRRRKSCLYELKKGFDKQIKPPRRSNGFV